MAGRRKAKPEIKKINTLAVFLSGRRVGSLVRLSGDRQAFTFEESYMEDPQRPTMSLSFKSETGGLLREVQYGSRRVPPFFANLLPEGHMREYLAKQAGIQTANDFYLLAVLGQDLAGAVTLTPVEEFVPGWEQETAGKIEVGPDVLRFSLAGVQLKFSAVVESSGGLTIPAQGMGGQWIVKLPSMRFDGVPENEYVMLELARMVGIDVPRVRLVPVQSIAGLPREVAGMKGNALVVERFDRMPDGKRIHIEDFAQVFGVMPENKYRGVSYGNLASVIWAEAGDAGFEFVRRLAFSVLIGNADMHLKNWSLIYRDGRTAELAPAYDFVSTLPYIEGDELALTFGGTKAIGKMEREQVAKFAEKARMPLARTVRVIEETVERTVEAWGKLDAKMLLPAEVLKVVDRQIRLVSAGTKLGRVKTAVGA
jgi:serine/threonine-protein kinase HipA